MDNTKIGLMVLSGGMDSAVALAIWLGECEELPKPICTVSFAYGQEALGRERLAAEAVTRHYRLGRPYKIDLPMIRGSQLTDVSWNNRLSLGPNVPTYVPMRNLILIAHAAALGYMLDATTLGLGIHATDAPYPDCSHDFLIAAQTVLRKGSNSPYTLYTPLLMMSKADIVRKGLELGVPFELTWTCYKGGVLACGECPSCKVRLAAFDEAGVEDPIEYLVR